MIETMRHVLRRIGFFLHRERLDRELDREMTAHLELAMDENLRRGMSREQARRNALIRLGGREQAKEEYRDSRGLPMLEVLAQDLRYAFRIFAKNPGFVIVAVLTLALGIGANSALYSVVNGVLLNPLPYERPNELEALYSKDAQFARSSISYPNFLDWRRENHSFSALAAYRQDDFNLTGGGEAERLAANMVSAEFFPALGVNPRLGRLFTEQEDQLGTAPVALIAERLWKRKYGQSADVLGKPMILNGKLHTIVGVIPETFHFESGNFQDKAEVYVPIGQWDEKYFRDRRISMGMVAVGRLKPGVTLQQAKADMDEIAEHLASQYPDTNKDTGISVISLRETVVGDIRPILLMLLAAVGFVLLIACANVANLLLARSKGRAREFAIRAAMGATPARMVRQLLTECILLALAGGALGLVFAKWGMAAAMRALPDALPATSRIRLDGSVLLLTLAVSLLAGVLFGLAPAWKASRSEAGQTLKEGGRGGSGTRHRTQNLLVWAEMALAVVLLAGAGLMLRSLGNLWHADPGFDKNNAVKFAVASAEPMGPNPTAAKARFRQLQDSIARVPGVEAASLLFGSFPMEGDSELPIWLEGEPKPTSQAAMKQSFFYFTQPDYLKAMKIPLKRGRYLQESDTSTSPSVVVVDERFAKIFFGDKDPIGKHVNFDILGLNAEIVGIVGHTKQFGLSPDTTATVQGQSYLAMNQIPDALLGADFHGAYGVARTTGSPLFAMNSITRAIHEMNPQLVVYGTESLADVVSHTFAATQFAMDLLGLFALLALVLSTIGIYGVISYVVSQRTNEIGIRMALGARRNQVLGMVLGQAGRIILLGVGIGVMISLALMRLMASLLFGVSPWDPLTLLGVSVLLLGVSLLACYMPARRATQVDPMTALRYE